MNTTLLGHHALVIMISCTHTRACACACMDIFNNRLSLINFLATVRFDQSGYSVDEDDGLVRLALVLSNPLENDVSVQVNETNGSATGKY